MLFPDLSAPEIIPLKQQKTATPIAYVADRFVAFVLDFLIFSPVVSLVVAGLVKQTKTYFMLNADSQEGIVAGFLVFTIALLAIIFLQSVFLYFWQATPGQFFMQMRVISFPHRRERLSYSQCLMRSILWCLSFSLLGLPFLEILSHPLRRALHERASDTFVLTLKKEADEGPMPLESRFIASWTQMALVFAFLFGVAGLLKTYHGLRVGDYRDKDHVSSLICKDIKDGDLQGLSRLDAAISLFLLDNIGSECLNKEAEAALWGDPVNAQPLAYLAKYLVTDSDEQDRYYDKLCEDSHSTGCALAEYLQNPADAKNLEMASQDLWSTQILKMEATYAQKDIAASLKVIENLQRVPALKDALEKKYVRSIWALQRQQVNSGDSRSPASVDVEDSTHLLEDFKERYGVE